MDKQKSKFCFAYQGPAFYPQIFAELEVAVAEGTVKSGLTPNPFNSNPNPNSPTDFAEPHVKPNP